ncbi:MAG: sulfotransferase domain-containing protein [Chloroflexota bacterium]|nr:sulfotransferase domain-containing protein [Chloroflexota bacterium]MDE2948126.1 sulfotransferase domain-containing protein [Chloroflexota bacterium]
MFFANTVVIATHRRSGMRWTIDALRKNSPDINDSYMSLEQMEADHDGAIPLAAFRRQLLNMEGRVLINVHDLPSAEAWQGLDERLFARTVLRNSPTIYVHRDGRDVMVSMYYYMQSFSETVRNQSFARFLRGEAAPDGDGAALSRPGYWALHVESWLQTANMLALSYDDLEADYEATVRRMAAFLDVRLNDRLRPLTMPGPQDTEPMLDSMLGRLGVRRRRGSPPDQARVGKSGDWRKLFDKRDREFFMKEAGATMRRLGYAR